MYFRDVKILEVACSEFVRVRGTWNMRWLVGWIKARNDSGDLIFDKLSTDAEIEFDCHNG